MSRVIHFEINADDPERAVKFYQDVFGWTIEKWEGPVDYWLATTGAEDQPGINGAIMDRMNASESTINTLDVPSLDEALKKVESAGGSMLGEKTTVPGVGYMAYCKDTEGNTFGLMQSDPSAS